MLEVTCTVVATADLERELVGELFALALEAAGPSFDLASLERRFARYPSVVVARDALGVAAFALVDARKRGAHFVYLGPLFSRRGAYVALFADYLEQWLDRDEPFCFAMEIENPLVRDVLALILPTSAHPRRGETPSDEIRALARIFAAEIPHVVGLDDRKLTTAIADPLSGRSRAGGRYALALVPSLGAGPSREALRAELRRGVEAYAQARGESAFAHRRRRVDRERLPADS